MRTVFWSGRAVIQFDQAIDYLANFNLSAGQALEKRIIETVDGLARRPIGRPGGRPATFEKRVLGTRYLLIYSLGDPEASQLNILRLYHLSQDRSAWTAGEDEA